MNTLQRLSSNNAVIQQMLWDNPSVFDASVRDIEYSFGEKFEDGSLVYHIITFCN
jgi:hypothetical protein